MIVRRAGVGGGGGGREWGGAERGREWGGGRGGERVWRDIVCLNELGY